MTKLFIIVMAFGLATVGIADLAFEDYGAVSIDFTDFSAAGFAPSPNSGQLDSDNWIATGFSDGSVAWGATQTSGDFARGARAFGTATGGVYSFTNSPGGPCLGVQPTADDFTSGSFVLRLRNNTTRPIIGFSMSYNIYCLNDQGRANSFISAYSTDNVIFDTLLLDYTSPEAADSTMTNVYRETSVSGLNIGIGDYLYVMWTGDDVGGSGSRDEFALDNITITPVEGALPHPWVLHVAPGSPDPVAPYTCWSNAAHTIQAALDLAEDGDTVLLTNNVVFAPAAELVITNGIILQGATGGDMPGISGGGSHRVLVISHTSAVVENVHFQGGNTTGNGGGIYVGVPGGRISGCLISSNTADYGGGVFFAGEGGTMEHCRLWGNLCAQDGGGLYARTGVTVRDCLIEGNAAHAGGGVELYSGGVLDSCTVVDNAAQTYGGGVDLFLGGLLKNCIVYSNSGEAGDNNCEFSGGGCQYTCTAPLPPGTGNIAADPLFVNPTAADYHLLVTSPCIDIGDPGSSSAIDLDGKARPAGNVVDMGCYEFGPLTGTNSPVHYVSLSGSNIWPYVTWERAAMNIQAAVDVAVDGDTVLVSNGVYASGSASIPGYASRTRVCLTKAISLKSVNGPTVTSIQGNVDAKLGGFGLHAARCLYVGADALVSGFTLEGGYTTDLTHGETWDRTGGGVFFDGIGSLSNCIVRHNFAAYGGGGCCFRNGGELLDSSVVSNSAVLGGGVYCIGDGLVDRCEVRGNSATNGVGGVYMLIGGRIANSLITGNWALNEIGGVFCQGEDCRLQNVTIADNIAGSSKGGLAAYDGSMIWNSIIQENTAPSIPDVFTGGASVNLAYCCAPGISGEGCISNEPAFVDSAHGDYRLALTSPCRNTGSNGLIYGVWDLDGGRRVAGNGVDMGAYESTYVHYVSPLGVHRPPFAVWADAATNIQAAVNVAGDEHEVLVTNGVYEIGGVTRPGRVIAERVCLTNAVYVHSVNGPDVTTIRGSDDAGKQTRCAYLVDGALLAGFRLENGATRTDGHNTFDQCGGGAFLDEGGVVSNCVIVGCDAGSESGGGLFLYKGGTATRCSVFRNRADSGGGAFIGGDGTITDSLFADNVVNTVGGGIACGEGGTIVNCTIAQNEADRGGGVYAKDAATFVNSIIYTNRASPSYENYFNEGSGYVYTYCCLSPLISGAGNTNKNPEFLDIPVDDYHLNPKASPCIDAGNNAAVLCGLDLDGALRIGGKAVDMGAYEYGEPFVAITSAPTAVYGEVEQATISGTNNGFVVGMMLWSNTATTVTGTFAAVTPWSVSVPLAVGTNLVTVTGWNGVGDDASDSVTIVRRLEHGGESPVHYVALPGGGLWPYTNWVSAATNIQDAIDVAMDGDTVLMDDGVFTVSQQVSLDKGILLTSVSGPGATVIEGGTANRCVHMAHSNAVLENVTLRGGHATHGGGVYIQMPGGTVRKAIIENCRATYGAGVFFGGSAGGVEGAIERCIIRFNSGLDIETYGGGVYLRSGATAKNCLVHGNLVDVGGGLYCYLGGTLKNCTVVSNTADLGWGGGVTFNGGGIAHNSIIYGNNSGTAPNWSDILGSASLSYCCTDPIPSGSGHVSPPPLFMDSAQHDYRLTFGSPCIDTGADVSAYLTNDLVGAVRPLDGDWDGTNAFDMGCYEYDPSVTDSDGDGLTDAEEITVYSTSPTNANTDGDPMTDGEEIIADTNPTNAASFFHIIDLTLTNSCTVWFNCSTARVYDLEWVDNLTSGQWSTLVGMTNKPGSASGTARLTDTNQVQSRFYRVGVRRP